MPDARHETALRLTRAGLPIILLYGPSEGEPQQRGKKPRHNGWQTAALTLAQVEAGLLHRPESNIGCVTGLMSGLVCVDIDPRNEGDAWLAQHGARLAEAGAQVELTGSGGTHLWFAHPGGWIRSRTGKHGIAPGVELLADGGHQAVIAPSIHHTGARYLWQGSMPFEDVRDFGAALPAWIATPGQPGVTGGTTRQRATAEEYSDHEADIEACRNRLAELEPAVEGAGGNAATFRAACFGRDHNLTPATFRGLLDEWNLTCVPPWTADDLTEMVRRGYLYSKAPTAGQAAPSRAFTAIGADGAGVPAAPVLAPAAAEAQVADLTDWRERIAKTKDGQWKSHVRNVELVLTHDARLNQCFRYNLFTNAVEVVRAPWRRWTGAQAGAGAAEVARGAEWSDDDAVALACWIAGNFPGHPTIGEGVVHAAVRPFARASSSYHPVRDYLQGLVWDGRGRLSTWPVRYLGAMDSEYVRAIGPRFLIGACARVMQPGCKLDTMVILEGKQGLGKSTAVRVLFDPWYTDADLDPGNKDTSAIIRGHWGVEFGEMHGAKRSEVTQLKAFLSRREDRQRDAYGRVPETHPRQSVFIGTTNSSDYLLDQTGGRRFWPIACGRIDLGALADDRGQLWAEAFHMQQAGAPWWLDEEGETHAAGEQAQRRSADELEDLIAAWLARGGDFGPADGVAGKAVSALTEVTGFEVWSGVAGGSSVTFRRAEQQRVADCMRALGWKRQTFRRDGKVIKGFVSYKSEENSL